MDESRTITSHIPTHSRYRYMIGIVMVLFVGMAVGWFTRPIHFVTRASEICPRIQPYFSPNGGARQAILEAIASARDEIFVALYSFTDSGLAQALIQAHDRGVEIRVIVDDAQNSSRHSQGRRLAGAGIIIRDDAHPRQFHHKFMIADGNLVITGSMNWSKNGENNNAENTLVIRDAPSLAARYREEFLRLEEEIRTRTERRNP